MSLINDAIRRANQHPPEKPSAGTSHLHLEPVASTRLPRWPFVVMPLLLATMVSIGVIFLAKGWHAAPVPVSARELPAVKEVDPAPPAVTEAPAAPAEPAGEPAPPEAPSEEAATAAIAAEDSTPPVPATAASPTFPDLQLKGIYYRPSKPSAVINNQTLYIGDRLQQAQVIGITADSVTILWNDETRVLTLR